MVYQYEWKRNMPVKAQEAGEFLEGLEKEHGEITPKIVLNSARSEDALLHSCFEWDDSVAAEKYREDQAGFLIRNLVVNVVTTGSKEPQRVRAYVNVSPTNTGSFIAVKSAFEGEATRMQILRTALRELQAFQSKYKQYQELAGVFAEIDALEFDIAGGMR